MTYGSTCVVSSQGGLFGAVNVDDRGDVIAILQRGM